MSLDSIRERAAEALTAALETAFSHRPDEVMFEVPPKRELGRSRLARALPLARELKTAPRQIAEKVADATDWPEEIVRVEIAGPGFLNLYLDRNRMLADLLSSDQGAEASGGSKTVVEHTNINPNKAAHIGHLRNSVLGDILVRCLGHLGADVEIQNYIDDTGVQVADVVVGLLYLPETELAEALGVEPSRRDELVEEAMRRAPGDEVPEASTHDFDDLCWDIYPRVTARYEADPDFANHRTEILHSIEAGLRRSSISNRPCSCCTVR